MIHSFIPLNLLHQWANYNLSASPSYASNAEQVELCTSLGFFQFCSASYTSVHVMSIRIEPRKEQLSSQGKRWRLQQRRVQIGSQCPATGIALEVKRAGVQCGERGADEDDYLNLHWLLLFATYFHKLISLVTKESKNVVVPFSQVRILRLRITCPMLEGQCSGLNGAPPPKTCLHQIPGSCDYYLIWKKGLCRCNKGSWDEIILYYPMGPKANDKCSYKSKAEGDSRHSEEVTPWWCDQGGRD